MNRALFIFRRDLRLEDNTGLIFALKNFKEVIVSFIFTPEQIEHNSYRSDHSLQFMCESLEDLETETQKKGGQLYFFFGKPSDIVEECIQKLKIDGVVVNEDYTPYSQKRDESIKGICKKYQVEFHSLSDLTLHPPEATLKANGEPYTVFTPFYKHAIQIEVPAPVYNEYKNYYTQPIPFAKNLLPSLLPHKFSQQKGGRAEALKILKKASSFENYATLRDLPCRDQSTLSPHLKFTTCSPREVYHAIAQALGRNSELIRSLHWRDFFTSIAFYFPHVFEGPFKEKFKKLSWREDKSDFQRWCEGQTGVPIVDAGMRQLNTTGFMHNRIRMITASFLVKDLHLNWQWGEKYFAQTLIDYDPAVNNGNWQWVASTGCDAQPYFRIFNPWSQSAKFDPDAVYIKQWIPELRSLDPRHIHKWHLSQFHSQAPSYPAPMVDHAIEGKIALKNYSKCFS